MSPSGRSTSTSSVHAALPSWTSRSHAGHRAGVSVRPGSPVWPLCGYAAWHGSLRPRTDTAGRALARALFQRLSAQFGTRLYQGGPGVSFSADDFSEVVYERAGTRQTVLVPAEIAITGCFLLLQHHGAITIPITGYPGAAPTFRLMMHPDGGRFGLDRLEQAIDDTFEHVRCTVAATGSSKNASPGRG